MTQIILDFGSGNTCENKEKIAIKMIDELAKVDTHKHEVIIKWQLFEDEEPNKPLDRLLFHAMCLYAYNKYEYKTTASVFDLPSLKFLLDINLPYDLPFIKIANRPDLYWLIGEVPRKTPVYVSVGRNDYNAWANGTGTNDNGAYLFCISKYPTDTMEYKQTLPFGCVNVSDHTSSMNLFKLKEWSIFEMHIALNNSCGIDVESGVCKTLNMLEGLI